MSSLKTYAYVFIAFLLLVGRLTYAAGLFAFSNEREGWRFYPEVRTLHGTIIGVGSFRVLDKFAFGQFGQAVLLDNDPATTKFNGLLPEMFLKPRVQFLEELVGANFDATEKAAIERGGADEIAVLKKYVARNTQRAIMTVWAYEVWGSDYDGMTQGSKTFFSHLLNFLTEDHWPMTCLGNPAGYRRVQQAAKEGNILVALGNWEREADMRMVGDQIRRSDHPQVTVADFSNSHNYFRRPTWELEAALGRLPLHPEARLLMTRFEEDTTDGWRYFSMPVSSIRGTGGDELMNAIISEASIETLQTLAPVQNLNLLDRDPILADCRRLLATR